MALNASNPADIRAAKIAATGTRNRDLADQLGITEADLVAAHVGRGATAIAAHPDQLIPPLADLGEVMALTRNLSAVHEKVGVYENYHSGEHAAMLLNPEIDLRIFPAHWAYAFAVETKTDTGTKCSIQIFDAAGDAVHKIFLRDTSNHDAWPALVAALRLPEQSETLNLDARQPTEPAKTNPERADALRGEWVKMTDTHQFMKLCRKVKMNRLGAYRVAGAPYVHLLQPNAVETLLARLQETGQEVILFVGNRGCIQIHWGPIQKLVPAGPWINVMDPGFNLHLRADHIAEVYAVDKPTQRGPAISVEAFDKDGMLILQIFGKRNAEEDHTGAWAEIVNALPHLAESVTA